MAAAFFVSIELGVVNFKKRAGVQSIDSYAHRQTTNSCPDHNTLGGLPQALHSYSVCLVILRAWKRGWFFFAIALCAHTHACAMRSSTVAAGRFADGINPWQSNMAIESPKVIYILCIYIYTYIERERESHYIYIYIHTYIHRWISHWIFMIFPLT